MEIKTKLISVLRTFSNREKRAFADFLSSPFHNKNQKAFLLFGIIKDFHPDYDSELFTKESVYQQLYGDNKFKDWKVRNVFSDLYVLAEEFLVYLSIKRDKFLFQEKLITELTARKLFKAAKRSFAVLECEDTNFASKDGEYFRYKFITGGLKGKIHYAQYDEPDIDNTFITNEYFRTHFLINYLTNISNVIDAEWSVENRQINRAFLQSILNYLKENEQHENAYVRNYYYLIMSIIEEDEPEHYFKLKEILFTHYLEFRKDETYDLCLYLQNYSLKKIHLGDKTRHKELFGIYKWILKNQIIEYEEFFLHTYFNNFVNCGIANGEINWTLEFIEKYKHRLRIDLRDTVVNYNLSKVYRSQKDYGRSLEFLSKVQPVNSYYKLHSKVFYQIVYYEMKQLLSAQDMSDTFRKLLKRDKTFSKSYKIPFYNFARFFQQLLKLSFNPNTEEIHLLIDNIRNDPEISQKEWLLEKASALLN